LEIGDKGMSQVFFQTTYKTFNGPKNLVDAKPSPVNNNKSFQSSIQIGGDNNKFSDITSTGAAFMTHSNFKQAQPDKSFEKNLRANHFALAHTDKPDPLHYRTSHVN
jgi:hypothetical protein